MPDFITVFDFDWSDMYKDESVRQVTLKLEQGRQELLIKINSSISNLSYAIFDMLGYDQPFSYTWYEYNTDIHSSVYLAYGGYYRQAIGLLRSWLELVLAGLYFEKRLVDDFKNWRVGKFRTPSIQTTIKSIWLTDKPSWVINLENFTDELDSFVHNRGIDKSRLQSGRDNVPRYIPHSYDIWYQYFKKSFSAYVEILINTHANELKGYFRRSPKLTSELYNDLPADMEYLIESIIPRID